MRAYDLVVHDICIVPFLANASNAFKMDSCTMSSPSTTDPTKRAQYRCNCGRSSPMICITFSVALLTRTSLGLKYIDHCLGRHPLTLLGWSEGVSISISLPDKRSACGRVQNRLSTRRFRVPVRFSSPERFYDDWESFEDFGTSLGRGTERLKNRKQTTRTLC
jgi:hypothetical protein